MADAATNEWSVEFQHGARSGQLGYIEGSRAISIEWELGGDDVVLIFYVGRLSDWNRMYPWAAGRRQEILERVGGEVIRRSAPGCRVEIDTRDDGYACLLIRDPQQSQQPSAHDHFARARARYLADGSFTITET